MSDIVRFLQDRMDEDEAALKMPEFIARSLPPDWGSRMVRELKAKRRILVDVVPEIEGDENRIAGEWGVESLPWDQEHPNTLLLLQLLALPYDQHPDYDPDWRPA